jgi:hypothetical protein
LRAAAQLLTLPLLAGMDRPADGIAKMDNLKSYATKSDAELLYIIRDAAEAAAAMRNHDATAEAKYLDQLNDATTILVARRQKRAEAPRGPVIEFSTVEYEAAHGRKPRGSGSWAFFFHVNDQPESVPFWYTGSLANGKKSARAYAMSMVSPEVSRVTIEVGS